METLQDRGELVFLYQLVPGHSDTSYACHIASMAGLPTELLQRAAQVGERKRRVKERNGGREGRRKRKKGGRDGGRGGKKER